MIASGPKTQQDYKRFAKQRTPQRPVAKNVFRAFVAGGTVCLIGQFIQTFYTTFFNFTERTASNPTVATLIFLSVMLTGFGMYDRIGQWAGAGTSVPVTGFANAMAASALEHKSEGLVLGVGGNMFKLAGPVIVYGTVAAFVVALIRITIERL